MTTLTRPAVFSLGAAALVVPLTTVVSHAFSRSTYPLLLPAIKDDVLGSNTVAGIGGTVIYIGYLAGVVLVTALAGRIEPMTILRAGLVVSIAGLATLCVAPNVPTIFAGLLLSSGGGAGIWITAPGLATENVPPERRGLVIGFLTASTAMATSLLALGTRFTRSALDDQGVWRPIYGAEAIVGVLILLAVVLFVRSRSTTAISGGISLTTLRKLANWKRITVAYVVFGAIAAGYSSFLAEAMEEDGGLSRNAVANVYIAMGFTSVIVPPLIGVLSDRIGRRETKIGVLSALTVGSVIVALGGRWLLIGAILGLGGMWASYPTLTATYVRDHLDAREFASAYGTMTIFYGLAAVAAPAAAGVVADRLGNFTVPYLTVAAFALFATVVLLSIPGEKGQRPIAASS